MKLLDPLDADDDRRGLEAHPTPHLGPREQAERLMLRVHTDGRAVVATGNREAMERHVEAMHGYGLQATVSRAEP